MILKKQKDPSRLREKDMVTGIASCSHFNSGASASMVRSTKTGSAQFRNTGTAPQSNNSRRQFNELINERRS